MRKKINTNSTRMTQIELINTDLSAKIRPIRVICVLFILFFVGCGKNYTPEQKAYIAKIEKAREEKNEFMKNNSYSPFNTGYKVEFSDLDYFDVDPEFVFKSKLIEYQHKDTITILSTKGEERKSVRFGYLLINFENQQLKINVYESNTSYGEKYYSIWFTDKTTNKETYGVGKYLDFKKVDDSEFEYTIDFNLAYNPFCAYNSLYSCAIPTKEDYIPIAIRAGEKKFHD